MTTSTNKLLIASKDNNFYLRAIGHLTANLCFPARTIILNRVNSFLVPFDIYIDLSEITHMDSTFLGTLLSLEKAVKSAFGKHAYIVRPSEVARKLLKSTGLDISLIEKDVEFSSDLSFEPFDDTIELEEVEKLKIILDSHGELCNLTEENQKRFGPLCEILKQQLMEEK